MGRSPHPPNPPICRRDRPTPKNHPFAGAIAPCSQTSEVLWGIAEVVERQGKTSEVWAQGSAIEKREPSKQKKMIALTRERGQREAGQRAKWQESRGLRSPRNLAHNSKTEIVDAVNRVVEEATRGATIPRINEPGAAA